MGANAHLVVYPISGGRRINVVAVVTDGWNKPGWSEPGDAAEVARHFAAWPAAARALIGAVESWRKWALFGMPDGGAWNRTTSRSSACGASMLPYVAQAPAWRSRTPRWRRAAADAGDDAAAALARYAAFARRASRVIARAPHRRSISRRRGRSPADQAIRLLGGARLLARQMALSLAHGERPSARSGARGGDGSARQASRARDRRLQLYC